MKHLKAFEEVYFDSRKPEDGQWEIWVKNPKYK
jgi:hypothetical protein